MPDPQELSVSVITVCFNSAAHIADALRSIDAQTWQRREHIVVDGASRDGTLDVVAGFQHPQRQVFSEADSGIYDAMNKGLALATGDIVGFLNSDDVYADTETLQRVAQAFRDPQVDVVYGDLVFVAQDDPDRVVRYWKSSAYTPGACATGWMPPHPTFYARRSVYEMHGGFDLAFPVAADFEMALRLLDKAHVRAHYIPSVLVRMRMGGESTRSLKSVFLQNRETSRACLKHGLPGGARFVLRRLLSKLPQLVHRP